MVCELLEVCPPQAPEKGAKRKRKDSKDEVFLVDFGLACKYRDAFGFHAPEEPDERKAHDGTLEYTSRDAHTGAHSRRGDLETLGYNMVHWAAGTLPWLSELEDPEKVI